jgi:hypothetical protein
MLDRSQVRLLHGGHRGAESEFGRAAEEWGLRETTLSFEGHKVERAHNVDFLSTEELAKGRVSLEFVFQRSGRRFVRGKGLRAVFKMMFQLVTRSEELFAIGWIQPDDTVRGGTGWGVELARVFNRPVHVFDQEREGWFSWEATTWVSSEPLLHAGTFAATGTRNLTESGKQAIRALFERSLGPALVDQPTTTEAG